MRKYCKFLAYPPNPNVMPWGLNPNGLSPPDMYPVCAIMPPEKPFSTFFSCALQTRIPATDNIIVSMLLIFIMAAKLLPWRDITKSGKTFRVFSVFN